MSAYDLSANQGASLALGGTGVLSTSISGSAAYCRPLTRSTSSASTVSQGSTDLQLGKLDVSLHQLKTSRSGQSLLASELKRTTSVPSKSTEGLLGSKKRSSTEKLSSPALPAVDETSCDTEASLDSSSSVIQLPPAASPTSANTSPVTVPPKRQHTGPWETAVADQPDFIPPHLLSAQTMPSDFIYALGSRPGSVLEGVGRKLRGADAARFREAVMKKTGFLEPGCKGL